MDGLRLVGAAESSTAPWRVQLERCVGRCPECCMHGSLRGTKPADTQVWFRMLTRHGHWMRPCREHALELAAFLESDHDRLLAQLEAGA